MIKYTISLLQNSHIYKVLLQFTPKEAQSIVKLPAWIPGSYMIREFSKNIISINACQKGKNIECEQTDKNSWQIKGYKPNFGIEIEYEVYALDFGIRTSYLDNKRGYFNATSLCLYLVGYEQSEHIIQFNNLPRTWNIATGLNIKDNKYLATNYDELIDSPFELGEFMCLSFTVKDVAHQIVLSGTIAENFNSKRLIKDVTKICETQIDMFGGIVPFAHYTFLLYLGGEIYTGLEHRNSTALMAPYHSVPTYHMDKINDDYLKLLALISHEYFHLWNVKRIKPQIFNPYDLQKENYTNLLWWFEGITSYYDDLILYRSGLTDKNRYLQIILDNINSVYKYAGVTKQSLVNSSLTAWVKYYRQDENSPNSIASYYVKGALVGLCLDLHIRSQTKGEKSLDDVLLGLYDKWLNDGRGINETEISELIKQYTGCNLSYEILAYTATTAELPLIKLFKSYGLELTKSAGNYTDSGRILEESDKLPKSNKLSLGIKAIKENLGYKVGNVYDKTAAADAGIAAGDLLIAIDNIKITDLDKQLELYTVNCKPCITLFRQEQLINIQVNLKANLTDIYHLKIIDEKQLANWL
ncbi:MAG: family peptidase [Burkholderiales bacterium]|jgi:predicted metalloprotease with PDZ domain|nr:family peptidase [Burkholderiales bacterium]